MKKVISISLCIIFCFIALCACTNNENNSLAETSSHLTDIAESSSITSNPNDSSSSKDTKSTNDESSETQNKYNVQIPDNVLYYEGVCEFVYNINKHDAFPGPGMVCEGITDCGFEQAITNNTLDPDAYYYVGINFSTGPSELKEMSLMMRRFYLKEQLDKYGFISTWDSPMLNHNLQWLYTAQNNMEISSDEIRKAILNYAQSIIPNVDLTQYEDYNALLMLDFFAVGYIQGKNIKALNEHFGFYITWLPEKNESWLDALTPKTEPDENS